MNMKKNLLTTITLMALVTLTGPSSYAKTDDHSEEKRKKGWYVSSGASLGGDLGTQLAFKIDQGALSREGEIKAQEDSVGLDLGIGFQFANGWRVEGNVLWVGYDIDDLEYSSFPAVGVAKANASSSAEGSLDIHGALLSVYYDFENRTKWVPYIGLGAGVGRADLDVDAVVAGKSGKSKGNDSDLLVKAEAGISYRISERAEVSAAYTFISLGRDKKLTIPSSGIYSDVRLSRFGIKLKLKL